MTCSVVMELDTGMVSDGFEVVLSRRAYTRITPLSFSVSLKPRRTAGRRPSFLFSLCQNQKQTSINKLDQKVNTGIDLIRSIMTVFGRSRKLFL